MKNLKNLNAYIFLFVISILYVSCSQDDEIFDNNYTSSTPVSNSGTTQTSDTTGVSNGSETSESDIDNESNPQGSEGEITLYKVEGSEIVKTLDYRVSGQDLAYQQDIAKHNEIWDLIKKVVPSSYRVKMSEFLIFNGSGSETAGFVVSTQSDLSKWQMGIAIDYADDKQELVYTIIHEFGHIVTLNNDQIDAGISKTSCGTYFPGEGCSKKDSYINKLQSNYWSDIWSEFLAAKDGDESLFEEFYNTNESRFVTQYAATNPGEDIAEVFTTFVIRDSGPKGSSIAEKKIQLMYAHNELIELREYIRTNLNSSSARGVRAQNIMPKPGGWKKANTFGNSNKSH